jgi:hypothetical protein
MANKKYSKHVFTNPLEVSMNPEVVEKSVKFEGEKDGMGANFTLSRSWITQPFLMIKKAHKHDFDQILVFAGPNPLNADDFDAEIVFHLGDEEEEYIVTKPTIIHVPKGLTHGPLLWKRLGKPVEFLDISLTPKYIRKSSTTNEVVEVKPER